jgi:hypothetical protein
MRKFLLASVAALGTGGLIGTAMAQQPVVGAPTQGQQAFPPAGSPNTSANNNNNYQAPQLPGVVANPTPGTIVIHVNGRVLSELQGEWGSLDHTTATATVGPAKVAPLALDNYMRLYFGADAMATNGLRYGAGIELRENFPAQASSNSSSGASGYTSGETVYVRRAFTYLAGEQWGILRVGQADGIIGIFDNGVTTNQFLVHNFNGGDNQNVPGGAPPFWFLSQAGNEYGNSKVVYISPQIAGFDFGLQWAPNTSNGYGIGACGVTLSGCPTLSSGPGANDGARILNQTVAGVRYQGKFGDLGLLAYAAYEFSGHGHYTGPTAGTAAFNTLQFPTATGGVVAGSRYTGNYDRLSFGSGGVALTAAGFTLGVNAIGGRLNGQLALAPQGGVPELAYTVGLKYVTGPLTVGVVGEIGWYQGDVRLTGVTQRRGRGITAGALYTVAPGLQVFAEYLWEDQYQGNFNFGTTSVNSGANNNFHSQGFTIGNIINF